jgi:NAD-dependent DNA ligase
MILTKELIKNLESDVLLYGNKLSITNLEHIILKASYAYYNTDTPILSDNVFDTLIELLKEKAPDSKVLNQIGSQLLDNVSNKSMLPYHLGSMDKVKPGSSQLRLWLDKYEGPFCISEKLDGLSGLLVITCLVDIDYISMDSNQVWDNIFSMVLYTRGDGTIGHNISHLLPYINCFKDGRRKLFNIDFMKTLVKTMKCYKVKEISLRGEIIISKELFESMYKDKYPKARSLVAGIVNSKPDTIKRASVKAIANNLQFVIYQVISPFNLSHIQQFNLCANTLNILTANYEQYDNIVMGDLTSLRLQEILISYKEKSKYEIDGIIIADDSKIYSIPSSGNPKYAVAFKMVLENQVKSTIVENVEYNISKNGILKPRVKFAPVIIGGDTITFATGFNAKFIKDNKIGKGAKIKIIRSGDVIPYIANVISPAKDGKWQEPTIPYQWNITKVDAIAENKEEQPVYQLKQLYQFFTIMDIDGLKKGMLERLMHAGIDTITLILKLDVATLLPIEGFQLKSATKLIHNIKTKILDIQHPLYKLMHASNIFTNFGEKKLMLITNNISIDKLLYQSIDKIKISDLTSIDGFSTTSGMQFLNKLSSFRKWLTEHPSLHIKIDDIINNGDINKYKSNLDIESLNKNYIRKNIVITGVRNKELETILERDYRCKIQSNVRSNTNLVIANDINSTSNKLIKAKALGIKIIAYKTILNDIM